MLRDYGQSVNNHALGRAMRSSCDVYCGRFPTSVCVGVVPFFLLDKFRVPLLQSGGRDASENTKYMRSGRGTSSSSCSTRRTSVSSPLNLKQGRDDVPVEMLKAN